MIDGSTRLFFIVGDPIEQVKSPEAFNRVFKAAGMNAVLLPLNVDTGGIDAFLEGLKQARNVDGVVLTVPHKFAGYRHCDEPSERSRFLQVANVLRPGPDGRWQGDMVDGLGYVAALRRAGCEIEGRRVLLVGAGGAGCAIAEALVGAGARSIMVHDENPGRRDALVRLLAGLGKATVSPGGRDPSGADIVINATPMGMRPEDPLPVSVEDLASSMFVGDVITVPVVSPLLQAARERGCRTMTGPQMYDGVLELMLEFFGIRVNP
jgi:shikimate dehydrogenase